MRKENIIVQGIENQNDMDKMAKALYDVWGVQKVDVNLTNGEAVVSYDENAGSLIDVKQAILDSGYKIINNDGTFDENKNE
ncbi:heavy-metal-associated domain-containing protein [Cytobacillus horneckiae]|uniref:heavy-metal-associated domain-containing protein n=1 Tax=Cytobacillus horneckiae TaxID=549687 RepID=UPI003D9A2CBA